MKLLKTILFLFILLLFLFYGTVSGQISQGGLPIQIQQLKSIGSDDLVVLPEVDNEQLRQAQAVDQQESRLKPFRFAHPFDTILNLKNSGKWYSDGEINVWQLKIRSKGAFSLNVIFGKYNLPDHARLFLIGSDGSEIKGAYTSLNNSESHLLAVEPLAGDELLIQYEEPVGVSFPGELEITLISHDFIGIITKKDHRPLGLSGDCNVNVNCDVINGTEEVRDAVCRIIIEGKEACTGTLINNASNDGTPYLLTAFHCLFDTVTNLISERKAQSSVFLFNYESPTCLSIDGDVSRSLSGSSIKASFDSLDFALVRLNNNLPSAYRPYFAGWNRRNQAPSSSISIHHPLGDIKKAAKDNDNALSARFSPDYLVSGTWRILRWDYGVTENGSSGGPLFDQNQQLIGTLTGGAAKCGNPINDYFVKFALAWDYRKETNRQLKAWLDPANSNVLTLNGRYNVQEAQVCKAITNFTDNEPYSAIQIVSGTTKKGYFSGTNVAGYTDFAEQYKFSNSCEIQGITLGIAKAKTSFTQAWINVEVYEGNDKPTTWLYSQKFDLKKLYPDAMNYLKFQTPVKTSGNFFITYNIQELHPGDSLVVYMANRTNDTNSYFLKNNGIWNTYNSQNTQGNGSALLTELIACSIDAPTQIDSSDNENYANFYPNPLNGLTMLTVKTKNKIDFPDKTVVYDLLGKVQHISYTLKSPNELMLNLSSKRPGIYFVHVKAGGRTVVGKIAYIP